MFPDLSKLAELGKALVDFMDASKERDETIIANQRAIKNELSTIKEQLEALKNG